MTKGSLKDKLEGNHLDLSLSGLTTVPVKEIIALRKVTSLDLSCNLLKSLPDDFCTLTQLMKVDLSKNELHELPENFGALRNLRHLDLLGNQLSALPVGCCSLDELRWLDLKDNPLEPGLRAAAGDCLDEAQCRKCAKQVVLYMKQVQSAMESQRQKLLQQERALEAAQREAEQLDKRAAKQADKERRRADYASKQKQQQEAAAAAAAALTASAVSEASARSAGISLSARPGATDGDRVAKVGARQRGRSGCCAILGCSLLAVLAALLLAVAAAYFYCRDAQGGTSALASRAAEQCHLVASAVASLRRQAEERLRAVRQRLEL